MLLYNAQYAGNGDLKDKVGQCEVLRKETWSEYD